MAMGDVAGDQSNSARCAMLKYWSATGVAFALRIQNKTVFILDYICMQCFRTLPVYIKEQRVFNIGGRFVSVLLRRVKNWG